MSVYLIIVNRNDIELISNIEAYGTWVKEKYIADEHNSYDIWEWNGKFYKIFKDSERVGGILE